MQHTYVAVAPAYELEDLRDSEIPVAFVTVAPVYEFGGFRFEYHYMIGPSKLNKNVCQQNRNHIRTGHHVNLRRSNMTDASMLRTDCLKEMRY